ncbi:MAG: patatin-like phospholipase family protein [Pseudomonadota bacterium]
MNRRELLKLLLTTPLLHACGGAQDEPRIGLALGGGGAKGLAHIPMLEVLDEFGIKPHRIAGSSIGAVIGALYASGMSGRAIRKMVDELTVADGEDWLDSLFSEDVRRWFSFLELKFGNGGLVDSSVFIEYLGRRLEVERFEQLAIPLQVVAADFWQREEVVFSSGDLLKAIQASIAIPGLFEPVKHAGRVLVDGGMVNPVPYDLLFADCDWVIAVDVLGRRSPDGENGPSYFETTFNAFQIMQRAIMDEKRRHREPAVYLEPAIEDIRVLEFYKADAIYAQSESERRRLERMLEQQLGRSKPPAKQRQV